MGEDKMKLAILDMYDGTPNQGMRAIQEIVRRFDTLDYTIFDVRGKGEVPDTSYDIYISSGGPGDPLDGDGVWNKKYFDLIDRLWEWNKKDKEPKKYVFFICHSFQMIADHFDLGRITKRRSMSFGTYPCHLTNDGEQDPILRQLSNPFCVADFRYYQFVEPDMERFEEIGADILALEKIRPHVDLERAIMAVRFSDEFFGTQFHPEADSMGMLKHFKQPERMMQIIEEHGEEKYFNMIADLSNLEKIALTNKTVLPNFINQAIQALTPALV